MDHNTLQTGFENSDDHRYLQTMNANYGIHYSRAGNGYATRCTWAFRKTGRHPSRLRLAHAHRRRHRHDRHRGRGLDVAVAMGGGPFFLACPRVVNVRLCGKLRPWVSAKDIILHVLSILTTRGNVGTMIEYTGPGVRTLSVPERATITNMGAELGVTTSVFPSDELTRAFLRAQGREAVWRELLPDPDAAYDRTIEIDLADLRPMIARPHSPTISKRFRPSRE